MDGSLASRVHAANTTLVAQGNLDAIREFFAPGYVAHLTERDLGGGHEGIRRFLSTLQGAFPDLQVEVEVLVEGDNRIAWQRTLRGTHQGEFMGVPASGQHLVWRDMLVTRFEDGLIAEEWAISDLLEQMINARHGGAAF